jgi:hypothetical protein
MFTCALALATTVAVAWAQDEKKGTDAKSAEKEKVKAKVPMYFGQIGLSKKQEEDVRKAALPFDEKIHELRQKVKELEKQIDEQEAAKTTACEKLLNDSQKTALKGRRETAEKEAAERKRAGKKAADGDEKKPEEKKAAN